MLLVVDSNVMFSALIGKGNSFKVFELNNNLNKFEFIIPEFLFLEIGKEMDRILSYTKLSKEELSLTFTFIKKQLTAIPSSDFIDKLPEAIELNFKDSPYLALALKSNCGIFSGDKVLKEKQNKVKVFSPRELLDILENKLEEK